MVLDWQPLSVSQCQDVMTSPLIRILHHLLHGALHGNNAVHARFLHERCMSMLALGLRKDDQL
eukprot:scaffold107686_cov18-Tisochrysis_lutea.AAC.1